MADNSENVLLYDFDLTQDRETFWKRIESLDDKKLSKVVAINTLISLIHKSKRKIIRLKAIRSLGKIAFHDRDAINTLIYVLLHDPTTSRYLAAESLSKIAIGEQRAIDSLVEIVYRGKDRVKINCIANVLCNIAVNNETAINAIIYLLKDSPDLSKKFIIAKKLHKISPRHPQAITAFLEIIARGNDYNLRYEAMNCLSQFATDNSTVINELQKIAKLEGREKTVIEGRKIAKIGLQNINRNWFNKICKIMRSRLESFKYLNLNIALLSVYCISYLLSLVRLMIVIIVSNILKLI